MYLHKNLKKINEIQKEEDDMNEPIVYIFFSLIAFAGTFFYFLKKTPTRKVVKPAQKIDIEIRYESEKDATATQLAQNTVKVIRMVLMPLETEIKKQDAKLIFVYGGDYWEMRLKNSSPQLKNSVRQMLEAQEW
ncbi:MAG: hypothetical protein WKF89_09375 [Chitinophagaceae bacterium]